MSKLIFVKYLESTEIWHMWYLKHTDLDFDVNDFYEIFADRLGPNWSQSQKWSDFIEM